MHTEQLKDELTTKNNYRGKGLSPFELELNSKGKSIEQGLARMYFTYRQMLVTAGYITTQPLF